MPVLERKPTRKRRPQQVRASICPQCGGDDTIVYKTMNVVRYCLCRDPECGRRWAMVGPPKTDTAHSNQRD
jgi:hypothetical protein